MSKKTEEENSYISHVSAAILWEIPCLHVVLGYPSIETLLSSQDRIHRSFLKSASRNSCENESQHVRSTPLPKGTLVNHRDALVASPELVFLDLAKQLSFHQMVLLGMQLCASSADGAKPLTNTAKLARFLNASKEHKGVKLARQTAKYIADNSWSIMESLLYIFLTLPNNYGGYGLAGAKLNHGITLKGNGRHQKGNKVFADLYWEQAKLVVEYDSYEFHNTSGMWVKDARRLTTLECNGFNTLAINTAQIYNDKAFAESARVIARYLGKRIQIRTKSFTEQKRLLRGLLPSRET